MAVKPDWNKGFTTGLRYWLFFIIAFFLLRYDWALSIAMGAIGGLAVSVISSWWNAKENDRPEKQPKSVVEDRAVIETSTSRTSFRRYGSNQGRKAQTSSMAKERSKRNSGFFRRHSTKSRQNPGGSQNSDD